METYTRDEVKAIITQIIYAIKNNIITDVNQLPKWFDELYPPKPSTLSQSSQDKLFSNNSVLDDIK